MISAYNFTFNLLDTAVLKSSDMDNLEAFKYLYHHGLSQKAPVRCYTCMNKICIPSKPFKWYTLHANVFSKGTVCQSSRTDRIPTLTRLMSELGTQEKRSDPGRHEVFEGRNV